MADDKINFDDQTPAIMDASKVRSVLGIDGDTGLVGNVLFADIVNEAGKKVGDAVKITGNELPELGDVNKYAEVYGGANGRTLTYGDQEIPLAANTTNKLFWDGVDKTWSLADDAEFPDSSAKAKDWAAGSYFSEQTAVKDGVLYRVKVDVEGTTGEPGVSEDWEPIGSGTNLGEWDSDKTYKNSNAGEIYVLYGGNTWALVDGVTATGADVPGISSKWVRKNKGDNSSPSRIVSFHTIQTTGAFLNSNGVTTTVSGSQQVVSKFYPVIDGDSYILRNFIVTGVHIRSAIAFYSDEDENSYLGGYIVNGAATIVKSSKIFPPDGTLFYKVCWVCSSNENTDFSLEIVNASTVTKINEQKALRATTALSISERAEYIPILGRTPASFLNFKGDVSTGNGSVSVSEHFPINENQFVRVTNGVAYTVGSPQSYVIAFYDNNGLHIGGKKYYHTGTVEDTGYVYPPKGLNVASFRVTGGSFTYNNIYGTNTKVYRYNYGDTHDEYIENIACLEREFNPDTEIESGIISGSNGTTLASPDSARTKNFEEIPRFSRFSIKNLQTYTTGSAVFASLAFYDSDKMFLSGYTVPINTFITETELITPPVNAVYYKYTYRRSTPAKLMIHSTKWAVNKLMSDIRDNTKPFVFIGDSIAQGFANAMTPVLTALGYKVYHRTVGGESCLDTLARFGIYPYVAQPFTIPALDTEVDISLNFSTRKGWTHTFDENGIATQIGSQKINPSQAYPFPCVIAGISGVVRFDGWQTNTGDKVFFKRNTPGDEVIIENPVEIYPDKTYVTKDATVICFMGTNGGWYYDDSTSVPGEIDMDNLVNYYKLIAKHISPNDFVFLGFCDGVQGLSTTDAKNWINSFERKMQDEFGYRYFSVRRYLMSDVKQDLDLTWTESDIDMIVNKGRIPLSVRSSPSEANPHFSVEATRAAVNLIFEKLYNLRKIDEHIQIPIYP